MKTLLLALFFWQSLPGKLVPDQQFFRYKRTVTLPDGAGKACLAIDPQIFPNAAASLKDLRLYQAPVGENDREIPYAITLSEPSQPDTDPARILNLGMRGNTIVFDLQMPPRPYTEVVLDLAGTNYLATANVSGADKPNSPIPTRLGEFTLFDLTGQHLSRNTTLHLQESSFPYLHIELTASPAPGNRTFKASAQMVEGATIPPSREAQTIYTTVAQATTFVQRGRQTIATFPIPERVPIERVSFALASNFKSNFSRDVRISDRPAGTTPSAAETIAGTILRVHLTETGRDIRQQQLSVPATLGSNLQSPAAAEVSVENGDDAPLPLTAVRLEMRERKLCFDAATSQPLVLFYGDPALTAPQYDYARLFSSGGPVRSAQLGPQQINPAYRTRPDSRPLTERHPDLLWIALLAVVCCLSIVAIRSSRRLHR